MSLLGRGIFNTEFFVSTSSLSGQTLPFWFFDNSTSSFGNSHFQASLRVEGIVRSDCLLGLRVIKANVTDVNRITFCFFSGLPCIIFYINEFDY